MTDRIILRRLAFTGPGKKTVWVGLGDGLNVVWGASNTGKSFLVKSLDFMTGAGPERLPPITERQGFDRAWLDVDLPGLGQVQVARALVGGELELRQSWGAPDNPGPVDRIVGGKHGGPDTWSAILLKSIGVGHQHKIAKTLRGEKDTFSFRFFAPYVFIEETDMLGDRSAIRISDYANPTLDKNNLKFILTGVDDVALVKAPAVATQRTGNAGKLELIEDMLRGLRAELGATPDTSSVDDEIDRATDALAEVQTAAGQAQEALDGARRKQAYAASEIATLQSRREEVVVTLDRFGLLDSVYESDVQRLTSLLEGSDALLAGARRPCAVCGAAPEDQTHVHGAAEVEANRRAALAELGKIDRERAGLGDTIGNLRAELTFLDGALEKALDRLQKAQIQVADGLPAEAETRRRFEELSDKRERLRARAQVHDTIADLERRKADLERFKAISGRGTVIAGVDGSTGHILARHVEAVLEAWRFPGNPTVSFDPASHEIQIDGKTRAANGKGVRALMNSAFKIGLLAFCRAEGRPHPGFLVLDSPLLSYREPHTSKHGPLAPDEERVKASGVKDHFYAYLAERTLEAQFIVIENDPPGPLIRPERQIVFAGPNDRGERQGLF